MLRPRFLPFIALPFTSLFPAALNIYWLTFAVSQLTLMGIINSKYIKKKYELIQEKPVPKIVQAVFVEDKNRNPAQNSGEKFESEKAQTIQVLSHRPKKKKKADWINVWLNLFVKYINQLWFRNWRKRLSSSTSILGPWRRRTSPRTSKQQPSTTSSRATSRRTKCSKASSKPIAKNHNKSPNSLQPTHTKAFEISEKIWETVLHWTGSSKSLRKCKKN